MKRWLTFAAGVLAGAMIWTTAWAAIPDSDGVIHGCYNTKHGDLRVIDTETGQACDELETALPWNQTGPQGPQGEQGPEGPQGPQGLPGLAIGYEGTRIPIGFAVPGEYTEIGHITLPGGFHMVYATVGFNNPTTTEVLVRCRFVAGREGTVVLQPQPVTAFFDAGDINLSGWVLNSSQTVHRLECQSIGTGGVAASAHVVGGEITAIQVTTIRLPG
jgi:hypothetical protein